MDEKRVVIVTGGSGFIGSHTILELLECGYNVVCLDDNSNSSAESLKRVENISSRCLTSSHYCDITDQSSLDSIFSRYTGRICAVIHFAGLKAVGESQKVPLKYFKTNVGGSISLLETMKLHCVKNLIFSSSATVYGGNDPPPDGFHEDLPTSAVNTYGRTKIMIEEIIRDTHSSDPSSLNAIMLRYFNPVGAHPSGDIGESPLDVPNNVMPYLTQVAVGKMSHFRIFGSDYPTPDGTGVRDYIHVVDLAKGHISALKYLFQKEKQGQDVGCLPVNLGSGKGYSVLELLAAMNKAAGKEIPHVMEARRPGDAAIAFANPKRAKELFGWEATLKIDDFCRDAWNWQSKNPNGYS